MLEADPQLVSELTEEAVEDVLDLGSEGFDLDGILLFAGRTESAALAGQAGRAGRKSAIRNAVFAQSGRALGDESDGIRIHTARRVGEIHRALAALPHDVIEQHYEEARRAIGPRLRSGPEAMAWIEDLFVRLRALYAKAAERGQAMVTFMV